MQLPIAIAFAPGSVSVSTAAGLLLAGVLVGLALAHFATRRRKGVWAQYTILVIAVTVCVIGAIVFASAFVSTTTGFGLAGLLVGFAFTQITNRRWNGFQEQYVALVIAVAVCAISAVTGCFMPDIAIWLGRTALFAALFAVSSYVTSRIC